jgi:hypothetical protein
MPATQQRGRLVVSKADGRIPEHTVRTEQAQYPFQRVSVHLALSGQFGGRKWVLSEDIGHTYLRHDLKGARRNDRLRKIPEHLMREDIDCLTHEMTCEVVTSESTERATR